MENMKCPNGCGETIVRQGAKTFFKYVCAVCAEKFSELELKIGKNSLSFVEMSLLSDFLAQSLPELPNGQGKAKVGFLMDLTGELRWEIIRIVHSLEGEQFYVSLWEQVMKKA